MELVCLPWHPFTQRLQTHAVGPRQEGEAARHHSSCLGGFSLQRQRFKVHFASDRIGRRILSPHELNPLSQSIMIAPDKTDAARVATLTYHAMLK